MNKEALSVEDTLKLALEALEAHADIGIKSDKAITSLRQAIAEAEKQEQGEQSDDAKNAVAEIMEQAQVFASAWSLVGGPFDGGGAMDDAEEAKSELRVMVASLANAATPQQRTWVGLTEEEVIDLWPDLIMHRHTYQFWQNLEAKLKEKNT